MHQLKDFIQNCNEQIEESLNSLIPSSDTDPKRLYEAVRWSLFGEGKRFRSVLLIAVGEIFGAQRKTLLRTASAVEMIHTYSLIHDDLPAMDDDDLRRGRATCHKKFDEATAILAGDILQSLAFQAIAEDAHLSDKIKIKLISELASAAAKMVDGQQMDLDGEGNTVSLEELENIHRNKTGAMIAVSARSGAIIGEANEKELNAVTDYASSLGLLFQITDDLLDITQTTEILGKTAGKDLRSEKSTYPSFYGIEKTRKLAEKIHAEAINELKNLENNTEILCSLADFILNRKS